MATLHLNSMWESSTKVSMCAEKGFWITRHCTNYLPNITVITAITKKSAHDQYRKNLQCETKYCGLVCLLTSESILVYLQTQRPSAAPSAHWQALPAQQET